MRFGTLAALAAAVSINLVPGAATAQNAPPPPLEYYGDLASLEEAQVSHSGAYTAMLMTAQGERVITVTDATGNPVKQLAVGDAKVRGIEWVGDHAILLLRTETGRLPRQFQNRREKFWRGNVIPLDDNRPVISIFAGQRNIANAIFGFRGVRQVDGRWIGYFGGFRRGRVSGDRDRLLDRAPALFAVDLDTGATELAALPDDWPDTRRWLIDDAGEVGAVLQLDVSNGNFRIENSRGSTIARGQQTRGAVSLTGFTFDGSGVIYSFFDDDSGARRRFAVDLTGGEPREVWGDVGLRRIIYQANSSRVLGIQRNDGSLELDDETAQATLTAALEAFSYASHSRIEDWTPDFSALIARTSGNYDSGTWYRIDGQTGARTIIGLERPAIQGQAIGKVSTFSYEAQDGLEIRGILTLPPGLEASNLPVVILPHGGPSAHDIEAFDWWAQAFAARGYAVLQPNFRGSTGRGTAFVDAGDGEWGRKMQSDKSDGLAALAEAGIVDADRACIVGASYGGYAALAGVTLQQDIYRCAVSVNGVADLGPMLRDMRNGPRDIFTRSIDRQFGDRSDADAVSPRFSASRADAPILLIHARNDTVVPYAQSVMMFDALRDANKPVEFVELEGEDHWLSRSETRKQMLEATMDFVERHNPAD